MRALATWRFMELGIFRTGIAFLMNPKTGRDIGYPSYENFTPATSSY